MRSTKAGKLRKLSRAQNLAEERAVRWRVYLKDSKGNALAAWRIVKAGSREHAVKKVRRAVGADPCLSSSEWRTVYQEVGL